MFTAEVDEPYQCAVWKGIETRAKDMGVGVICFVGHRIDSPIVSEATANVAYQMADDKNLDGLIIISTTIATFIDKEKIGKIFSSRKRLPQISVGCKVPGIPSITVNGLESIGYLVEHLVRVHGRRRIALIGGPQGHPEAEERELEFRKALARESVSFDERLVAQGDFMRNSGALATKKILAKKIPFDALFCMNDRMAFGALDMLHRNNLRVPEDVAVVGFDGVEESSYKTPPLTTVEQPLTELGYTAVDTVLDILNGKEPEDKVLICRPLIRQSCGCPPRRPFHLSSTELAEETPSETVRAVEELTSLILTGDEDRFISHLNTTLATTLRSGGDLKIWHDYLSVIRRRTTPSGKPVAKQRESLFEFARALLGDIENRHHAERRVAAENKLSSLRSVSASLSGGFEMNIILHRLETGLQELGIGEGFLVLFQGEEKPSPSSRLMLAPKCHGRNEIPEGGIRFQTKRLLPRHCDINWRESSWVLEPLVFQDEPLGYMMLPGGLGESAVYDALAEQVSSALKGTLLLQQVRSHEKHLEVEVARRTAELIKTNKELTREIQRRMHLEQEVSQISNLTMQRIGQDLHDDICQHLAGVAMHTSVLQSRLSETDTKAAANLTQIGDLLSESINRTKQIARGLYPAGLPEHGLVSAVEELVESIRRSYQVSIHFIASQDFVIDDTDTALQLYRIIQEALANAVKHAESKRIQVGLYLEDRGPKESIKTAAVYVAEVIDYGKGMPPEIPDAGMGLRIMRYRAKTIGAELVIERLNPGTRVRCRGCYRKGTSG